MIGNRYNSLLLNEIIESKDFARCFSKLEEFAINKNREGSFGVVKEKNSPNYLFTPKIIFGSQKSVGRIEGLKYSKDLVKGNFENKSIHSLYKNDDFKKECLKKEVPFEIDLLDISKRRNWNDYVKNNGEESLENFENFLLIHNHPGGNILPSKRDLHTGFLNSEESPFYEIITAEGKEGVFPFLVMEFKEPINQKIIDSQYKTLRGNMANWLKYSQLSPDHTLLHILLGDFKKKENVLPNFEWGFFKYNLNKNKTWRI